jgi:hypothetical protein
LILVQVGTTGLVLRFVTRIILSHGVQEKTERVVTCTNPDCVVLPCAPRVDEPHGRELRVLTAFGFWRVDLTSAIVGTASCQAV